MNIRDKSYFTISIYIAITIIISAFLLYIAFKIFIYVLPLALIIFLIFKARDYFQSKIG